MTGPAGRVEALLPHLAGLVIEKVEAVGPQVFIRACVRAPDATCSTCTEAARRVHSRYQRHLADAAIAGQPVVLHLRVRRFFCDNPSCRVGTFAEQVKGLTTRYARRTELARQMLAEIALALGGRWGCPPAATACCGCCAPCLNRSRVP